MKKFLFYLFYLSLIIGVLSASIIDMIISPNSRQNDNVKNCVCNGPTCICCIDFNVSFIDLGGPGCVRLNYLPEMQELEMNVTYGDSFTQREHVKGLHPEPICLNLLSTFAQVCARLNELIPSEDDGFKGCLLFEPTLLGEPQLELGMGCFHMGQNGMKLIDPPAQSSVVSNEESEKIRGNETLKVEADNNNEAENADEILAFVSESANKGIALISDWFGFSVSKDSKENTNNKTEKIINEDSN